MVAALVAALTGWAAATGAEPDPSSAGPRNTPPVQFQLHYPGVLRDADLPNPAARVTVAGRSVWLLFDTGAGVHMLASWFVEAAGLPTGDLEGMSGRDSTGRDLPFRAVRDVPLRFIDGSELALPEAAVTEFPLFFKEHEVAGVLSPQLLSPAGSAAVLDLRVPELRIEEFEGAVRRLYAVELQRSPAAKVCSEVAPLRNRLFAVPVSVGGERASLALDSGAAHSKLSPTSPAARGLEGSLEDGGTSTGLSGVADAFKIARRVSVQLGKHAATIDLRVGSNRNTCGPDGILGLDVMSRCAFVLAEQRIAFACGTR
jgi:hypothetical protein